MPQSNTNLSNTKNEKSTLFSSGLITLLALVVLGGGALIFMRNSPTFNVRSEGGKGGNSSFTNVTASGNNQQGNDNQVNAEGVLPGTSQSSQASNSTSKVDVAATNVKWTLVFPVYQLEKNNCSLLGNESVSLTQNEGNLSFSGVTNGYGGANVKGTITPAGQVNLSLSGNGPFVTFEGENPTTDSKLNATVITGKVTAPSCPEGTFKLSRGN